MCARLSIKPDFVVNTKGEKKAVILSWEQYEELLEELEDLRDVSKREKEPTRLFSEYHKERMRKK